MLEECRALLLDLSGVLYDGDEAIGGSVQAVKKARDSFDCLRFITNTATKSTDQIVAKLQSLGIELSPDELFTAPSAARQYALRRNLRPFLILHPSLREEFSCLDQTDPNCVILGDARDGLNYAALNHAFQICKTGAPLIAIGKNKYFSDNGELQMDAGGFVKAVEWAADCEAVVMGKPGEAFYAEVVASTGLTAGQCLMVGDDVEADVLGATAAGLKGCLVKTGKYRLGDDHRLGDDAICVQDLAALVDEIK